MTADTSPHALLISGSERPGGNTDQAVDYAKRTLEAHGAHADIACLRDHRIETCGSCGDCNYRTAPCHIHDDMPGVIEKMVAADIIVYAAPVHGFGMAHLMQIFIERAGVCFLRFDRPLANKVGGAIVTGRRYSHMDVYSQLVNNILLNRMVLIGSGYPAVLHGGRPGEADHDQEGRDAITQMVSRMVSLCHLLSHPPTGRPDPAALGQLTRNERERPGARN